MKYIEKHLEHLPAPWLLGKKELADFSTGIVCLYSETGSDFELTIDFASSSSFAVEKFDCVSGF